MHFVAEDPGAFNLHQEAVRKHRGRHHREPHRLRTSSALASTAGEALTLPQLVCVCSCILKGWPPGMCTTYPSAADARGPACFRGGLPFNSSSQVDDMRFATRKKSDT